MFRRNGVDVDPVRLEDGAAAVKSRARVNDAAAVERVRDLAYAAKKARRCELAEFDWRRNPSRDTLAAARAAQQARNEAEAELREACLNDEQLIVSAAVCTHECGDAACRSLSVGSAHRGRRNV